MGHIRSSSSCLVTGKAGIIIPPVVFGWNMCDASTRIHNFSALNSG
jgi:hypothetical protein